MKNKEFIIARRSLYTAIFFFLLCFLPAVADIDGMDGGFALIFISIVVFLTALITALLFFTRGLEFARLVKKADNFLAEWQVPEPLWRDIIERQFEEQKANNWILVRIVWFFCIAASIFILIYDFKPGLWVTGVMIVMMVLTGIAAFFSPRMRRKSLLASTPIVRIGKHCLIFGSEFHTWSTLGSRFISVELVEDNDSRWMQVCYSFATRSGKQEVEVMLPVPPEQIPTAERVAAQLVAENP